MLDLITSVKELILATALQYGDASTKEIKRQQELSPFAVENPDLGWTKAWLERLGLGMIVRVYRSASAYEYHLYTTEQGLYEEGQVCALFEFVNGNHVQAPALISQKRAIEARARCQRKRPFAPGSVLTGLSVFPMQLLANDFFSVDAGVVRSGEMRTVDPLRWLDVDDSADVGICDTRSVENDNIESLSEGSADISAVRSGENVTVESKGDRSVDASMAKRKEGAN